MNMYIVAYKLPCISAYVLPLQSVFVCYGCCSHCISTDLSSELTQQFWDSSALFSKLSQGVRQEHIPAEDGSMLGGLKWGNENVLAYCGNIIKAVNNFSSQNCEYSIVRRWQYWWRRLMKKLVLIALMKKLLCLLSTTVIQCKTWDKEDGDSCHTGAGFVSVSVVLTAHLCLPSCPCDYLLCPNVIHLCPIVFPPLGAYMHPFFPFVLCRFSMYLVFLFLAFPSVFLLCLVI